MSDMQAVKARLKILPFIEAELHLEQLDILSADDDWDVIDQYLTENKIKVFGGKVFSYEEEELDSCGFITKTIQDDWTIEIVALWYNGGASLDEILEAGLKQGTQS